MHCSSDGISINQRWGHHVRRHMGGGGGAVCQAVSTEMCLRCRWLHTYPWLREASGLRRERTSKYAYGDHPCTSRCIHKTWMLAFLIPPPARCFGTSFAWGMVRPVFWPMQQRAVVAVAYRNSSKQCLFACLWVPPYGARGVVLCLHPSNTHREVEVVSCTIEVE